MLKELIDLFNQGKYEKVESLCKSVSQKYKNNFLFCKLIGLTYLIINNYDESIYSVNQGGEINILDFIILKRGRFIQEFYIYDNTINTQGFTFYSKGFFNIIHYLKFTENPIRLKYNIQHISNLKYLEIKIFLI